MKEIRRTDRPYGNHERETDQMDRQSCAIHTMPLCSNTHVGVPEHAAMDASSLFESLSESLVVRTSNHSGCTLSPMATVQTTELPPKNG